MLLSLLDPFKNYLEQLTKIVEEKIRNILSHTFAIVLMGGRPVIPTILLCTLRLQMTVLWDTSLCYWRFLHLKVRIAKVLKTIISS